MGGGNPGRKGRFFELAIKQALEISDKQTGSKRFNRIWSWYEWAEGRPNYSSQDIGIDLVAELDTGDLCAIQAKFYQATATVSAPQIDSFISASATGDFKERLLVNTGLLGPNALAKIKRAQPRCRILNAGDLAAMPVKWMDFLKTGRVKTRPVVAKKPRSHQKEALRQIASGFENNSRGQIILPCGTGKTLLALWTAWQEAGAGRTVLYLVPSLALMNQTIAVFKEQSDTFLALAVCSDPTVGNIKEQSLIEEFLSIPLPVTTNPDKVASKLDQFSSVDNQLKVVFSTYQSLDVIIEALQQTRYFKQFHLALCDEAHRTVGADLKDAGQAGISYFRKIHNDDLVPIRKRLYLTATPKIYREFSRDKLENRGYNCISMDNPEVFGPEFYKMTFAEAIDRDLLVDYEILVIQTSAAYAASLEKNKLDIMLAGKRIKEDDAIRLLGCWDALSSPRTEHLETGRRPGTFDPEEPTSHMKRALAFSNSTIFSKEVKELWPQLIQTQINRPVDDYLRLEINHLDASSLANERSRILSELELRQTEKTCNLISNVKVLTEGVDVPSLDAVIFLESKTSETDIVQAVGRAMRRAPGKKKGYIVLPVIVPEDSSLDQEEDILESSDFKKLYSVIRALRAHDDRVDYWVNNPYSKDNHIKMRRSQPVGDDSVSFSSPGIQVGLWGLPQLASKVMDKCGDRRMWPRWGHEAAKICQDLGDYLGKQVNSNPKHQTAFLGPSGIPSKDGQSGGWLQGGN